ncbi:MAG: hypothetical protein ABI183_22515 [Polyangiaceae bacterium]
MPRMRVELEHERHHELRVCLASLNTPFDLDDAITNQTMLGEDRVSLPWMGATERGDHELLFGAKVHGELGGQGLP